GDIHLKTEPFKTEYKQNEFNFSRCSSAFFLGIVFVLVSVSLSSDLVYDREMKTKNQLYINGVMFLEYIGSYFILLTLMLLFIFFILISLIFILHVEGLDTIPAVYIMVILFFVYCPTAVVATACLSYFFDKADSLQCILPNVTSLIGGVPFMAVASLDMLGVAKNLTFALHVLFSSTNFVYIPFSIIYHANSVYRESDQHTSFIKYVNKETVALLMGCIGQLPVLWVILTLLDSSSKKSSNKNMTIDLQDDGDEDVKNERRKVNNIVTEKSYWPVIVIQNLRKEYYNRNLESNKICFHQKLCLNDEPTKKVAIRNLSLTVDTGEILGLLGHNGAGKTSTMKVLATEEKETAGKFESVLFKNVFVK
ncbi:cholesterol transporter ABCA5-like, partial [Daktulosphaira vitifoliae]|uniref:cholesterol transporter ABCA5-like n=1 Tax=Daktulosphaira vitifoliae TaxID=58002 RepID=UPI0021AA184C